MTTLKVKRTGAEDYGMHTKALVCGPPGVGKTLVSSTWPNPIYASAEGGLMSIADRNIPYIDIKTSDDLLHLKRLLDQPADVRESLLGFKVETVVLDTIDEIQKILIKERLEDTRKDLMEMRDWGWLNEMMQTVIRGFRNLPMHVVFTCHVKEVSDSESGKVWFKPSLQGGIADNIAAYVDFAFLIKNSTVTRPNADGTGVEKVQFRSFQTQPDSQHDWIKDRSGKLSSFVEINFQDDFSRIFETVFGNVNLPHSTSVDTEIESSKTEVKSHEPVVDDKKADKPVDPAPVKMDNSVESDRSSGQPEQQPVPEKKKEKEVDVPADGKKPNDESIISKGGYVPSDQEGFMYGEVWSRNVLPKGVKPKPCGHNTNIFCTVSGKEVESEQQADISRIRFRKILCREEFQNAKR